MDGGPTRPGARPAAPSAASAGRPAALLNGEPIPWESLRPALAEAAGGLVLEEVVLDHLLAAELARRGWTITPEEVEAERRHLTEAIATDAQADEEQTARLVASLRRSRGLGEHRFAALLERNARLRRLAAARVQVTPEDVRRAHQIRYGPRYRARVILVPTERQAAAIRAELAGGGAGLAGRFAEAAARSSVDPSGPRGGLLEPISPADPAYPVAIRRMLENMEAGQLSPVVAVDEGFALLLVEEKIAPEPVGLSEVAASIESRLRLVRERSAMDDVARELLARADVTVMDRALAWSWEARSPSPP